MTGLVTQCDALGKICTKCKTWKPVEAFYISNRWSDGYKPHCRACVQEQSRIWRANHQEQAKTTGALYYQSHKEAAAERQRVRHREKHDEIAAKATVYRQAHLEQSCLYTKKWRQQHPEMARTSLYDWRLKNPEKVAANSRRYRLKHIDAVKALHRLMSCVRRARMRVAGGSEYLTRELMAQRWELYGGRCWLCGTPATAIDHVKPLAKGGANWPCNLRPICGRCNSKKGMKWPYTGAAAEAVTYGPLDISGIERVQVRARESGVTATPGTLQVQTFAESEVQQWSHR